MNSPQDTLHHIIQNILPDDQKVTVDSRQEANVTVLKITAPEDLKGRIIGKNGRIIKAVRTIIAVSFPEQRILIKVTD